MRAKAKAPTTDVWRIRFMIHSPLGSTVEGAAAEPDGFQNALRRRPLLVLLNLNLVDRVVGQDDHGLDLLTGQRAILQDDHLIVPNG